MAGNTSEWFKVKKVYDGIYAIDDNGFDTMYLVEGSDRCLLIDTGFGIGNLPDVIKSITSLPVTVVNTHGHPDHGGGDYHFPEVYIASEDIALLKDCFKYENLKWAVDYFLKNRLSKGFSGEGLLKARLNDIIPIKEGHKFDLGDRSLEVIGMPGHSPGSIVLLDKKRRLLFSGDSILEGEIWMYLEESTTLKTYYNSLLKIKSFSGEFDFVLPAHAKTPAGKEILDQLIKGCEDILDGRGKGKPRKTFAGKGFLYRAGSCAIFYNEKRLL